MQGQFSYNSQESRDEDVCGPCERIYFFTCGNFPRCVKFSKSLFQKCENPYHIGRGPPPGDQKDLKIYCTATTTPKKLWLLHLHHKEKKWPDITPNPLENPSSPLKKPGFQVLRNLKKPMNIQPFSISNLLLLIHYFAPYENKENNHLSIVNICPSHNITSITSQLG